jgi:septum formation protein
MDNNKVKKIILASQSPRRRQLLQWAEIPFEIIVAPAEETYPPDYRRPKSPDLLHAIKLGLRKT